MIPLHLQLRHRHGLAKSLAPVVSARRRYSLISAPQDGSVSVPRLVQAVTAGQLSPGELADWQAATAALVAAALPADPQQPATWGEFALLLPHAQATMDVLSDGMSLVAQYLWARDRFRELVEARTRVHGPDHPSTLTDRANLARWSGAAGDEAGARDHFAALLPSLETVLGADHPTTLEARGNLARWTGAAGDAAAARDQFSSLLPLRERVLGREHPSVLNDRASLALWTGAAGDPAAARDQLAALVPVFERVSGASHPSTLNVRGNLARWTGNAGDPAAARDQLADLLPVRETVSGPEHPDTRLDRASLDFWTKRLSAQDQSGRPSLEQPLYPAGTELDALYDLVRPSWAEKDPDQPLHFPLAGETAMSDWLLRDMPRVPLAGPGTTPPVAGGLLSGSRNRDMIALLAYLAKWKAECEGD